MPRYLVTGGAGFIGSNLVEELLRRGETVRVLDNFSTGQRRNLRLIQDQIEVIEGDIRSYHIVQEAVEDVDYVLHQAALPSVPRSVRDPITSNEVNIQGTLNVLQAARKAGVRRLVYASSSSVYGDSPELPKHEAMCTNPLSPYAIAKLAGEQYCRAFWNLYQFETVALRYFNVFGPRQDPNSQYSAVIPKFIRALLGEDQITIHGDGVQSRDFTYIDNVVQANLKACLAKDAAGKAFNVAVGERHTILELLKQLTAISGRDPKLTFVDSRPGDIPHSLAEIGHAGQFLGYEPLVNFNEGLRRTFEWYYDMVTSN